MPIRILVKAVLAALMGYLLLFYGLDRVGLLSADEPRYAWIGREMARSGDWITPRLWGEPWFEKPALLYWMIGAGYRAGLPDEWAVRLPVALASFCFLLFYWWWLGRQFGDRAGWYATAVLATSAGWLSFSHAGVTDLPLAAAFGAAMLVAMRGRAFPAAGVLMGLAVLAKGLVPVVLAAPLLWLHRRRLRSLAVFGGCMMAVAAPWYVLCFLQNGMPFLEEFFIRHHISRFAEEALAHVRPFWFYGPVLLAGLFPWTPLLGLLVGREGYDDARQRFLLLWFGFGFVFFSISTNKLPGYLLPLLPALCALIGIRLAASEQRPRWWMVPCGLLVALIPAIAGILPEALRAGLSRVEAPAIPWAWLALGAGVAVLVWQWERAGSRQQAVLAIFLIAAGGALRIKQRTFPLLDERVSARQTWRTAGAPPDEVCVENVHRNLLYGLNFYSSRELPDCATTPRPVRLIGKAGAVEIERKQKNRLRGRTGDLIR